VAIYGWVMEPSTEPDAGHDHDEPPAEDPSGEAADDTSSETAANEEVALVD
jgi:hypothetical protein